MKKKTFKQLIKEPNFAIALAVAFLLAGWNLQYGSWWVGVSFLALIMGAIAFNVYHTRNK